MNVLMEADVEAEDTNSEDEAEKNHQQEIQLAKSRWKKVVQKTKGLRQIHSKLLDSGFFTRGLQMPGSPGVRLGRISADDVVWEVQSKSELESLHLWSQGDSEMTRDDMLEVRANLRGHPTVLNAIRFWWNLVEKDKKGRVGKKAYFLMHDKIHHALLPDVEELAQVSAEEDWVADSGGKKAMDMEAFFDAIFELADVWCPTAAPETYRDFLNRLLKQITDDEWPPKAFKTTVTCMFRDVDFQLPQSSFQPPPPPPPDHRYFGSKTTGMTRPSPHPPEGPPPSSVGPASRRLPMGTSVPNKKPPPPPRPHPVLKPASKEKDTPLELKKRSSPRVKRVSFVDLQSHSILEKTGSEGQRIGPAERALSDLCEWEREEHSDDWSQGQGSKQEGEASDTSPRQERETNQVRPEVRRSEPAKAKSFEPLHLRASQQRTKQSDKLQPQGGGGNDGLESESRSLRLHLPQYKAELELMSMREIKAKIQARRMQEAEKSKEEEERRRLEEKTKKATRTAFATNSSLNLLRKNTSSRDKSQASTNKHNNGLTTMQAMLLEKARVARLAEDEERRLQISSNQNDGYIVDSAEDASESSAGSISSSEEDESSEDEESETEESEDVESEDEESEDEQSEDEQSEDIEHEDANEGKYNSIEYLHQKQIRKRVKALMRRHRRKMSEEKARLKAKDGREDAKDTACKEKKRSRHKKSSKHSKKATRSRKDGGKRASYGETRRSTDTFSLTQHVSSLQTQSSLDAEGGRDCLTMYSHTHVNNSPKQNDSRATRAKSSINAKKTESSPTWRSRNKETVSRVQTAENGAANKRPKAASRSSRALRSFENNLSTDHTLDVDHLTSIPAINAENGPAVKRHHMDNQEVPNTAPNLKFGNFGSVSPTRSVPLLPLSSIQGVSDAMQYNYESYYSHRDDFEDVTTTAAGTLGWSRLDSPENCRRYSANKYHPGGRIKTRPDEHTEPLGHLSNKALKVTRHGTRLTCSDVDCSSDNNSGRVRSSRGGEGVFRAHPPSTALPRSPKTRSNRILRSAIEPRDGSTIHDSDFMGVDQLYLPEWEFLPDIRFLVHRNGLSEDRASTTTHPKNFVGFVAKHTIRVREFDDCHESCSRKCEELSGNSYNSGSQTARGRLQHDSGSNEQYRIKNDINVESQETQFRSFHRQKKTIPGDVKQKIEKHANEDFKQNSVSFASSMLPNIYSLPLK